MWARKTVSSGPCSPKQATPTPGMQAPVWLISFLENLEYCSNALVIIPLVMAVRRWAVLSTALRVLALALCTSAVLMVMMVVLHPAPAAERLLWHLYSVLQTLLFGSVFIFVFRFTVYYKGVLTALLAFLLLALADTYWLEPGQVLHVYTHLAQGLLLVGLAGLYLYQLGQEMRVLRLEHDPLFLVSSGVVMYFSATALLYGFAHRYVSTTDVLGQHVISVLVSLANLLQYGLFALAFHRAPGPYSLSSRVHE